MKVVKRSNAGWLIAALFMVAVLLNGCDRGQAGVFEVPKDSDSVVEASPSVTAPVIKETKVEKPQLKLQFETAIARYYSYDVDKDILQKSADVVESRYSYFQKKYKFNSIDKANFKFFPNYSEMIPYMDGDPGVPVISGTVQGHDILIQTQTPEDYRDLIIHEFTHYVLEQIGHKLPAWLNEGLATYEGTRMLLNDKDDLPINYAIKAFMRTQEPPGFDQMERANHPDFVAMHGYQYSYSLVDYITQTYGDDKMVEIVRKGTKWQAVLGVSRDELERGWHAYLKKKYGSKE